MSTQHAQYVLVLLVLAVNSDQFQTLQSFMLILMCSCYDMTDCCDPSSLQALGYEKDCPCLRQELDSAQVKLQQTHNLAVPSPQAKQPQTQQLLQGTLDPT